MKKIIFLDIDGVMNSEVDYLLASTKEQANEEAHELSKRTVKLLDDLVRDTGAEVVISSVWRYSTSLEELRAMFKAKGFEGTIIGVTPVYDRETCLRGNEILGWIKKNEEYLGQSYFDFESYVIFDDDSDMLYWQRENFILIDGYTGLTPNKTYKAKWILSKFDKS